jgi:hypothetical protein
MTLEGHDALPIGQDPGDLDQIQGQETLAAAEAGQGQEADAQQGGEQGQEARLPWEGQFESPEQVWSEFQKTRQEVEGLRSLKGRQGYEIGQLRAQVGQLSGLIQQAQAVKPGGQTTAEAQDLDALSRKFEDGEIDAKALVTALEQRVSAALTGQMEQHFANLYQNIQSENDLKEYRQRFMAENPGYAEAFNSGNLQPFLERGMSAEAAWFAYDREQKTVENERLKKDIQTREQQARSAGRQEGARIEAGKGAAGRVLGQGGAGQGGLRAAQAQVPRTHAEQVKVAAQLVQKMRSERAGAA